MVSMGQGQEGPAERLLDRFLAEVGPRGGQGESCLEGPGGQEECRREGPGGKPLELPWPVSSTHSHDKFFSLFLTFAAERG